MHRFSKSLVLGPLRGLELIQVALGENEIIFRFHPEGTIRIEGAWTLTALDGSIIDRSAQHSTRDAWRVHKILGQKITACAVRDSRHLEIVFERGVLEIEDDSDHYETVAIEHSSVKLYV